MVCWESRPQHTKECVCMDVCARVCVCTLGAALGLQKQYEKGSLQAAPHWWRLMLLGCSITLLSNSAVLLLTFSLAASAAGICVEEH